jgi:pimeloyl-ACP methyl ester carboxylesterase
VPDRDTGPPALGLLLVEGPRALFESATLLPAAPWLRRAPLGDGHPVLLLPGFTAGDGSTTVLRRYLKRQSFSAHPWLLGRNIGPRDGVRAGMLERVEELSDRYGQKISIVGWSLGGVYARELAKRLPDQVRQVVTLGSPFGDIARASNASRLFERLGRRERSTSRGAHAERLREPPGVPSTSIYTKTDGVVHWQACLEPQTDHTENIEIIGSHCGLGFNPVVLYAVADRLSQPDGNWKPFHRDGWRRALYREPPGNPPAAFRQA